MLDSTQHYAAADWAALRLRLRLDGYLLLRRVLPEADVHRVRTYPFLPPLMGVPLGMPGCPCLHRGRSASSIFIITQRSRFAPLTTWQQRFHNWFYLCRLGRSCSASCGRRSRTSSTRGQVELRCWLQYLGCPLNVAPRAAHQ